MNYERMQIVPSCIEIREGTMDWLTNAPFLIESGVLLLKMIMLQGILYRVGTAAKALNIQHFYL
jgi:hypothetical protein